MIQSDLPSVIPIFPLDGALLLPRGNLPLNIFETQYLNMVDYALSEMPRVIGIVQTAEAVDDNQGIRRKYSKNAKMAHIGCVGRITVFNEIQDDRYQLILSGMSRFKILNEIEEDLPFRMVNVDYEPYSADRAPDNHMDTDRKQLLNLFREFLYAQELEADWEGVDEADNETLINALCMMAPYSDKEKQALLEAQNLNERAAMLMAITEFNLVTRESEEHRIQ